MNRRKFLQNAGQFTGVGFIAASLMNNSKTQAARSTKRIKVGQIGTTHAHAAGKMATLRKLSEDYEVVGIVEPNPERERRLKNHSAYRGLKWVSEEQLLNTRGLQAVAVETDIPELVATGMRCCCRSSRVARHVILEIRAVSTQIWMDKMLNKLFEIVEDRNNNPVEGSYTNQLLNAGYEKTAQKVGEEAVEVIIASSKEGSQRTIEESADLIYHLFVLLVQQGISLAEVEAELENRHTKLSF